MNTTRRGFLGLLAGLAAGAKLITTAKAEEPFVPKVERRDRFEQFKAIRDRKQRERIEDLQKSYSAYLWDAPPNRYAFMQNGTSRPLARGDIVSVDLSSSDGGVFERVAPYDSSLSLHLIATQDIQAGRYGEFLVQGHLA